MLARNAGEDGWCVVAGEVTERWRGRVATLGTRADEKGWRQNAGEEGWRGMLARNAGEEGW